MVSKNSSHRIDCVFIRKSTQGQDEQGQIANVQNMLREQRAFVLDENWFIGTVSRRKVRKNVQFARLMELIESDQVGTVYIESQDRWGSADRKELFHLLYILEQHGTRLYDLRAKKDLTESDFATEMLTIVGSLKSEKELQDISYRSLRSRVNNFRDKRSWPTGTHPFGYGKACFSPAGRLLWVFQPISRSKGQVFYADSEGNLNPGPENVKIPRKDKLDRIELVPSNNPRFVETVKVIFDLYVNAGLSRRAISKRLNDIGYTHYDNLFTHPLVTVILRNPVYKGDTHFGKRQSGELHTFDTNGLVVALNKRSQKRFRNESERMVEKGTHEALVNEEMWDQAQAKLDRELEHRNHSPCNPAYYLKQLFRCGHCGKNLTGRTETDRKTRKKTVVYVCGSYMAGRCNGHRSECGYQRITHEEAEQLLRNKVKEIGRMLDEQASVHAQLTMQERWRLLVDLDQQAFHEFLDWVNEGCEALIDYLESNYRLVGDELERVVALATKFYENLRVFNRDFEGLRISTDEFAAAVRAVESASVADAEKELAVLVDEHRRLTLSWAKASDLQQDAMKGEIDRLEDAIRRTKARTIRLSVRVEQAMKAERRRQDERRHIEEELPKLEGRHRGEAFRRIFKTVTLYWKRSFHPAQENPPRPRKTERPGRYSYDLEPDRIEWEFIDPADSETAW